MRPGFIQFENCFTSLLFFHNFYITIKYKKVNIEYLSCAIVICPILTSFEIPVGIHCTVKLSKV